MPDYLRLRGAERARARAEYEREKVRRYCPVPDPATMQWWNGPGPLKRPALGGPGHYQGHHPGRHSRKRIFRFVDEPTRLRAYYASHVWISPEIVDELTPSIVDGEFYLSGVHIPAGTPGVRLPYLFCAALHAARAHTKENE